MNAIDMLNQIKGVLGIELSEQKVELEIMTLKNGTKVETDSLESGSEIFIVSESEDKIPLPIGNYETESSQTLVISEEGIIAEIKEAGTEEETEEAPEEEVEATEEAPEGNVKSTETSHKVVYATKEEFESLTAQIQELKSMLETKQETKEDLSEVEKTEEIELTAEVVEPIAHNPEAASSEEATFSNVTVQKAKYLNNLINQFNQ